MTSFASPEPFEDYVVFSDGAALEPPACWIDSCTCRGAEEHV